MTQPTQPSLRDIIGSDGIYAIGLFIVTWNQMETLMTVDVSILLNLSIPEVAAVMGGFSIDQKVKTLEEALKRTLNLPGLPEAKGWQKLPNKIKDLNNTRNMVAHGQWLIQESGKATATKDLRAPKWMGIEEIAGRQAELEKVVTTLSEILLKLRQPLAVKQDSSPPTLPPSQSSGLPPG